MRFRFVVDQPPEDQPNETECTCDEECLLPTSEVCREGDDRRRSDDRSDRGTTVENRHAERTLSRREPFGDRLRRTGPVARFAETQDESKCTQTPETGCESM